MDANVLVADDSGTMRKIIVRSLNAVGVTNVTEAADGQEALGLFQEDSFDLVLTDWNMPNMTGIELIRAIRETGATTPIVLVTTEAEKSRVLEAVQAGVSGYLVKPFQADDLRAKIESVLASAAS